MHTVVDLIIIPRIEDMPSEHELILKKIEPIVECIEIKGNQNPTMIREFSTINPATEEVIDTYEIMTKEQINEKTKKAQQAFSEWKTDIQKRADHIHDFAHELRKNKEELAIKVTKEMGKAIKEARSEVEKCAWVMDYFADNGRVFVTDKVVNTDARKSL